jgi:hypothetical protein
LQHAVYQIEHAQGGVKAIDQDFANWRRRRWTASRSSP